MATASQPNVMNIDLAYLDQSRQDLQTVKCVVVGDTGVGKTRLTCARACGTKYSLQQLTQTHVSTVWAIDHYRKDKEVLDRSWCFTDGLNVSLRIWDTFGYHDKDRRFAYGRADVVLLCFSLVRPHTLNSVRHHWYPEIRRLCGSIPIVLCGCQADLRYLYKDPEFMKIEKSPFFREILDKDILTPDKGRAMAKEIGAYYYESSVLEQYGIDEVFINCIRAALTFKRDKHFWTILGSLKHIRHPLAQKPLCPTKPALPQAPMPPSELDQDYEKILQSQSFCDVIFVVRGVCIEAHRACLIVAANVFKQLFLTDLTVIPDRNVNTDSVHGISSNINIINKNNSGNLNHFNTESNTIALVELHLQPRHISDLKSAGVSGDSNKNHQQQHQPSTSRADRNNQKQPPQLLKDTAILLENEETSSLWSFSTVTSDSASLKSGLPRRELNHQAFKCIELQGCEDVYNTGMTALRTVVTVSEEISPLAFQYVLQYLYTGRINQEIHLIPEVKHAAELIGLHSLVQYCHNILNNEGFINGEITTKFQRERTHATRELLINKEFLADVWFQLEDGEVAAHKALLMARCDMMFGMFNYNFRESSAKTVSFPGVSKAAFVCFQEYLYTDQVSMFGGNNDKSLALELIELANRMCLPRLMAVTEKGLVRVLTKEDESGKDVAEDVLALLEPAQLHNADHLAQFCCWFISCNFVNTYRKYAKVIGKLRPENQIHLHQNRWPSIWYLKELDFFERCQIDEAREQPMKISLRRGSDDQDSGCLGFCSRRNRRFKDVTHQEVASYM